VTALIPNMGAAEISMALGTRGPLTTECTACAASAMSIGNAVLYIRAGMADAMLAGGVEAPVVPLGLGGFGTMRALSRRNDDPEGASRPFDAGRDGFILAEGGAVLVLEELGRAQARGAHIYAEILGYGMSSDSHHVTEPDPLGINPARAMTNALADGGVTPDMIGYVNAHGTSTLAGDSAETRALKIALARSGPTRSRSRRPRARPATCWAPPGRWRRSSAPWRCVTPTSLPPSTRPIPILNATSITSPTWAARRTSSTR